MQSTFQREKIHLFNDCNFSFDSASSSAALLRWLASCLQYVSFTALVAAIVFFGCVMICGAIEPVDLGGTESMTSTKAMYVDGDEWRYSRRAVRHCVFFCVEKK
jgi:hypothetical protein